MKISCNVIYKRKRFIVTEQYTVEQLEGMFIETLTRNYSSTPQTASEDTIYRAFASLCRQIMSDKHKKFISKTYGENKKQVYYLSMEFLMGRSLKNSLFSLGLSKTAEKVLKKYDVNIENIYEMEPDAGLGNGGLGRLAACYLDALAMECLPATGYSILYEFGMFKQKIVDGWQRETTDNWLPGGTVWLKSHPEQAKEIRFGGEIHEEWDGSFHNVQHRNYTPVLAVPSDMYVSGYDGEGVSQLRLWSAKSPSFDMDSFNSGNYSNVLQQNHTAELISKVLYPNDNHIEGKILRLQQQYFLSAASVSDIVGRHLEQYGSIENLPDKVAIHINDTHPTLAIPELMRLLLDDCGFDWENAFSICERTFAYTNHTVMSEALECWNEDMFRNTLPRIYQIICEMDRRARVAINDKFPNDYSKMDHMSLIAYGVIRMANICCFVAHSINGVSKLHSEIIKESVFHDYYMLTPQKFKNVTNGIAYRRWLLQSNEGLTDLLKEVIGPEFTHNANELMKLERFADDASVLDRLGKVKLENKKVFADYIKGVYDITIDPTSIFDCQVKRLHEYKRQHLNALNILAQYLDLKSGRIKVSDFVPRTYIFGAKAAPGYYLAKQIIRLIVNIQQMLEKDPVVKNLIRIVYLEDYNVTTSERLMPASEVSEQISLAGTEASGTGNMKFMLSGAITIGTLDGANVEIAEAVGNDNFVQFGMLTHEAQQLARAGYHPSPYIESDPIAKEVLKFIEHGINGNSFGEIVDNLRNYDSYMVMADFADYRRAQADVSTIYKDSRRFDRMSLMNIANAGIFSADRSVTDYARDIWNMKPVGR